ncbi:ATP-dependent helicase HrpB [Desertibaculum subflavum]|uniref:ATP-dependent helicase HrpB n=1 Tax=Desertibaculum subflavum TaxID=2268458 RepID=UPI000E666753
MTQDSWPRTGLPVEAVLPELLRALATRGVAVLTAPPGAGKTTLVPLALLAESWLAGRKVVVLEPRRIAARAAARRMAALLGETVGETVGYRVRLDSKVGPRTRIEVVTEGLFLRRLQADPDLAGIGAVLFDEFHERSVDSDLALALTLEARGALREDLRLAVMSATLAAEAVAGLLGEAPIVRSDGRLHPVEVRHLDRLPGPRIEGAVADAVLRAVAEAQGDVLVFLPGAREIRATQRLLEARLPRDVALYPLYGDLSAAEQDAAIGYRPDGKRRVILSSAIAETSLTIEGVRIVVDSGLARVPRYDPASGMSRLDTVRVTLASAEQRRGRAGRLAPGLCYRLWPEAESRGLLPFNTPEILNADLAPLALELARWGVAEAASLAWLDPPPAPALAVARELLRELGALDRAGQITPHGTVMLELGLHPRLAHMLLRGRERGEGWIACQIAALLEERDIARGSGDADLRHRLLALRGDRASVDRGVAARVRETARDLARRLGIRDKGGDAAVAGRLVSLSYPDRIAQARGAPGRFRLAGGGGAVLPAEDALSRESWLAVAATDGDRREARIFLAAPLSADDIEELHAGGIAEMRRVAWDAQSEAVIARMERRFGQLVLAQKPLPAAGEEVAAAVLGFVRQAGLDVLPWTPELQRLRARVAFLRRVEGEATHLPDLGDAALAATLETWLGPFLAGVTRRSHLAGIDLAAAIDAQLGYAARKHLDTAAPTHLTVPSGSHIPVDYGGEVPVLAIRLQEMFGASATPTVAGGRVPVLLHLLSPAHRPLQVTRDLAGFWRGAYAEVRREMKGRYPKHHWPDDPLAAPPTARAKRRGD